MYVMCVEGLMIIKKTVSPFIANNSFWGRNGLKY